MTPAEARTFLTWAWSGGHDVEVRTGLTPDGSQHVWERLPYGDPSGAARLAICGTSYRTVSLGEVEREVDE